jgi:hypothetical protein
MAASAGGGLAGSSSARSIARWLKYRAASIDFFRAAAAVSSKLPTLGAAGIKKRWQSRGHSDRHSRAVPRSFLHACLVARGLPLCCAGSLLQTPPRNALQRITDPIVIVLGSRSDQLRPSRSICSKKALALNAQSTFRQRRPEGPARGYWQRFANPTCRSTLRRSSAPASRPGTNWTGRR